MDDKLLTLLRELEQFGARNDAQNQDRSRKMLNITRDTGELLLLLIRALQARHILEIGASNGYSTLWLAHGVERFGGSVVTLEVSPSKAEMARANFARAGLQAWIELHVLDAGRFLPRQAPTTFDFVFLDAQRSEYLAWWPDLQRVLAPGGLLVTDNAISHAAELADFAQALRQTPGYTTALIPVGNGELIALKEL